MTLASFLLFMGSFLGIGLFSVSRSRGTRRDYYLADHDVHPALVGLSAVATNNSGYMFIGVIGYTYERGLAAVWLMLGWIVGDFVASLIVHRQLREQTERLDEVTFAGVLARWHGTEFRHYRWVAAVVTVVFLGAYAAAQLSAGGKALQVLFGWGPDTGALLGSVIVLAYCYAGGIRASIWTDAAQSAVMVVAMAVLLVVATEAVGGTAAAWSKMQGITGFTDWSPATVLVPGMPGVALFILGWFVAGFSVIGQPHIMVRFMALEHVGRLWEARAWYYLYFALFYGAATAVGMLSRLHLPALKDFDPELALPTMALHLLSPALVGLVLAGIFAATMSTADSLILSCAAALTHDLLPRRLEQSWQIKGATAAVTAAALGIALVGTESVFSLVILAWSVLASAFGPLLIVYVAGGKPSEAQALAMTMVAIGVTFLWRHLGYQEAVYEGLPGMAAGLAVYGLARVRIRAVA
jgi:sodium/proline symporter